MKWDQRSASHQIYKTTGTCSTSSSFPLDNPEAASTQPWRSPSPHVQCLPVSIRVKGEVLTTSRAIHDPPAPRHFLYFHRSLPSLCSLYNSHTPCCLGALLEMLPLLEYSPPDIHLPYSLTSSQSVFTFHLSHEVNPDHPVQHSTAPINLAIPFSPTVFILF